MKRLIVLILFLSLFVNALALDGWIVQSTNETVIVGPFTDAVDGVTPETGLTVTSAEVLLSKDGAAVSAKNEASALGDGTAGFYTCALNTTDTATLGILLIHVNEAGAGPVTQSYMVVAANVYVNMKSDATAAADTAAADINLDHLIKSAVDVSFAGTVQVNSVIGYLAQTSAPTYDRTTDSQQAIADSIVAASPQVHVAESSEAGGDIVGTIDAGTYVSTQILDATRWQISPAGGANGNGFGLEQVLVYDIGTGLDRVPSAVSITGYFDANPVRLVHVWVYNYVTAGYDQLSDGGSAMTNQNSDNHYQYFLSNNHVQTSDGEVKVRFTSTSTTTGDDLYLNYVNVSSVAVEAAGLTAEAIAQAVATHDISDHMDHVSLGFNVRMSGIIEEYAVTTSDTASSFTCSGLIATTNWYQYHRIRVHETGNNVYADSWILSMDNAGVVILGKALPFTPDTDDELYIRDSIISTVEIAAAVWNMDISGIVTADYAGTVLNAIEAFWDSLTITGGYLETDLINLDGTAVKSTSGNIHALPGNI